ncbi:MAG: hypothetical protein GX366_03785 [Epulopiscium sp.]|nr:hypothetical protein [Candidatus Epulonipiscium sp.]
MVKFRKFKSKISKDEGSAIVLFVVILLAMTLMSTTMVTMAKTQYDWSRFSRRTSNSYHLAKSGAEKVVDNMNKEVAKALPNLIENAREQAHVKLMAGSVKYEGERYDGTYKGEAYEEEYQAQLKKAIYKHIEEEFINNPILPDEKVEGGKDSQDHKATKSDLKDGTNIDVKTIVYKHGSEIKTKDDEGKLKNIVDNLIEKDKVGSKLDDNDKGRDAFAVEVQAWAEEGDKTSLTKSRVVATVSLDQIIKGEELLEEYEWDSAFPETVQSAVLSFGDFVINDTSTATIEGDISVKGTSAKEPSLEEAKAGKFPEPDEYGGIVISNGGTLDVKGNALVVNNIQTTNSPDQSNAQTSINVDKDAIANTIAINDHYPDNEHPWSQPVDGNKITIGRNVFMDDDLRIDRYVQNSTITVTNSVFGISDGAKEGQSDGKKVYLNPNESSGVFAMGKGNDGNKITMGRAFLGGQAYINFGDGNGFHRLHESAGEPFEDVYYLEEYRKSFEEFGDKSFMGDKSYLDDFYDLIEKDKIEITETNKDKPFMYAPAYMSEGGKLYHGSIGDTVMTNQDVARNIFYNGIENYSDSLLEGLTLKSDWNEKTPRAKDKDKDGWDRWSKDWSEIIENPKSYYEGNNPYDKDFGFNSGNVIGYQGLEGYMMAKRGVFYKGFENSKPVPNKFDDLVDVGVFGDKANVWSRNNPIEIITGNKSINLDDYKGETTAIVCTNPDSTLTLTGSGIFRGIIVTPGKIEIKSSMTIEGIVIAGNEKETDPSRDKIRSGEYAGIQVKEGANPEFKYNINDEDDRNIIFEMRFLDKKYQRQLYDCLGMTNYKLAGEKGEPSKEIILGARSGAAELRPKVKLSDESVISSEQDGLQFVINSLKKL